jgi:2-polyprenyl-3-methyl-5-hydroxy-6-metoxy-1,4-benzoquinol methylase
MREEEIRPRNLFDEYLRLAALDAEKYFGRSSRRSVLCPACGAQGACVFSKHGFSYEECPACQTLFVSPRPPAPDFFRYYQESDSARFFATTFYRETAEARREKLWRPKAAKVKEVLQKYGVGQYAVIDIGGGYGILAEEYERLTGTPVTVIEPGSTSAEICRQKGLSVVEEFLEHVDAGQLPAGPKAFVSFELFEHLHDSEVFLRQLITLMHPGDVFFFTTLSGMGVDIQVLWEESKSISLQHLNFFNPKSVCMLLERHGFRVLQVDTPGRLDIDILYNNQTKITDRFWRNLLASATQEEMQRWQDFVADQGRSSHMHVICQRR